MAGAADLPSPTDARVTLMLCRLALVMTTVRVRGGSGSGASAAGASAASSAIGASPSGASTAFSPSSGAFSAAAFLALGLAGVFLLGMGSPPALRLHPIAKGVIEDGPETSETTMALTLLDDAYIEKPDWVNDGDPVSGHSGLDSGVMRNRPDGVANQLAAQLLSNLNMLRISRVNPMPSRFRHVNGLADTAAGGLVAPSGGLNAAAGDYIIVDYREAGANQAITRINLTGVTDGISVRLRRVPLDNGELPDVRVYQGAGSANPIIDGTGSRTWPTSPSRSSDASTVSGFGLDLSGQDAAGRSIDSATAARVDDLTFTYDSSKDGAVKWRAQPTALLEPSAQPILALLEQTRSALRTSIDTVATTGSVPASADSPGVVRLAGKAAASSRDSSTDDRAVTPAGVDAVMDGHEGSFAASASAAGHVLLATDSELNQGTPPTGKAGDGQPEGVGHAVRPGAHHLPNRADRDHPIVIPQRQGGVSGRVPKLRQQVHLQGT